MTKQEEINRIIWGVAAGGINPAEALQKLSDLGVVIKVGEISDDLATTASQGDVRNAYGVGLSWERDVHVFKAFKEAGYVAVEPLI